MVKLCKRYHKEANKNISHNILSYYITITKNRSLLEKIFTH